MSLLASWAHPEVVQRAVEEVKTIGRFKKAQVLGNRPLVMAKRGGVGGG